jgi:DNA polymerase III subunit epsilon
MILFFDTETTGKADFRSPPDAPHQPRLVQIGLVLTAEDGKEAASMNLIVKPDGFTIPEEASRVHGITTEKATALGVSRKHVLRIFREFWELSALAVAHNIAFDSFIVDGEIYRLCGGRKAWGKSLETFCTMEAMTPICKLPGNYGDFKWPRLQEAHKHAFGIEFDGAHDAMADVRACAKLYFWIQEQKKKPA